MLILASASQSRKKLLENCQIEFIQISSDFDETTIEEKNIFNLALELSFQKANSLSENIQNKSLPEEFNCGPLEILGFVFFDQLEDSEKIAKANFYYGQLQIINEIKFSI